MEVTKSIYDENSWVRGVYLPVDDIGTQDSPSQGL